jgi:DNA polymerase-3 subunit delta'
MNRLREIFGQEETVAKLRAAMGADRLGHGLIFSGPAGVGKGTCATALGGYFLCETPKKGDACEVCGSCKAILAGAHPDFHVITKEMARLYDRSGKSKATMLGIEVIRNAVAEPAGRKTVMGRGKVFIVEQAELMTAAAQNALLKTLEEPAGRTLIILLTTHANELLSTIRSRCQIFPFGPLKMEIVVAELKKRGIDAQAAKSAAELADGSLGVALRWIEEGILKSADDVAAAAERAIEGKGNELADLVRKSADAYAQKTLERDELASKDFAMREGLGMYLGIAAGRMRAMLAQEKSAERACSAIEAIAQAEKYLDANVNVAIVMEQLAAGI